jgi:protoporphyrinogen oxidase
VNKVLNRITVGHIEAIQEDYSEVENDHAVYNNSSVVKKDDEIKDGMLIVKDTNKLNDYTCFNVILPKYLPEGYEFARAEFYKDEDGNVSKGKYIDLYFGNKETGKEVFMQQRFAAEETAFTISTGENIEKVKINNVEGIVNGNSNVDWEYNGVIYCISAKKAGIDKREVIKIAESIK